MLFSLTCSLLSNYRALFVVSYKLRTDIITNLSELWLTNPWLADPCESEIP
jgi:hypothetical protein